MSVTKSTLPNQLEQKSDAIPFKTSLISLAKAARKNYAFRPTRDLNGADGLLIRTLGTYEAGFYIGIYFDSKKNQWADAELHKAREACYKYSVRPTAEHLVELAFKISDILMQKTILVEFKDKRPDSENGYSVEKNYNEALMAIESEIEALFQQTDNLNISRKLIKDLGKLKYSLRSNFVKEKSLEMEMGKRYLLQVQSALI